MTFPVANIDLIHNHLSYDPKLFVNRQHEIDTIQNRVRLAQSEQVVSDSVINYWGIDGIGKTWLLRYLNDKFSYRAPVQEKYPSFTVLFDFREIQGDNLFGNFAKNVASQVLHQLAAVLSVSVRKQLEATQKSGKLEELAEAILALSKEFTPLILLDHADMVSTELWQEIEKSFLEPIVSTGKVVTVVAGRRQQPRWRRFEVRRRLMESYKSQIKPFDKQGVIKQVENRRISIPADLLYPYTAGNPHLVDAFVQHVQLWAGKTEKANIDQNWINKHTDGLLQVLQLSKNQLIKEVREVHPRLELPLLAVAPLRFFRLEAMRQMLISQDQKYKSDPEGYFLQLVRDLDQETEIVWWDREKRAYVTSEVVRKLINRTQYLESPQEYISSHDRALEMYRQWAKDSPKTSDEFIIEILFHHASICEAKKDVSCLQSETDKALEFARDNLSTDRILALQKQIEGDMELLDLFPDGEREDLLGKVETLLNARSESL